jgi:fructosamine-3-kinase
MFRRERMGLECLAATGSARVPAVLLDTVDEGLQFLLMEWVEEGNRTPAFWRRFGEQVAKLHQNTNEKFGFADDNYIGSLPQKNGWYDNWVSFFEERRLRPQVELGLRNGSLDTGMAARFEKLYSLLGSFFDHEPASLLHGDLWGGNFICDRHERPVLIDPAIYYGHRSMDLAMTKLFGGFYRDFYDSYEYHFPLPANHLQQWEICNLYPLLVHLNLFGASYLGGIMDVVKKYT